MAAATPAYPFAIVESGLSAFYVVMADIGGVINERPSALWIGLEDWAVIKPHVDSYLVRHAGRIVEQRGPNGTLIRRLPEELGWTVFRFQSFDLSRHRKGSVGDFARIWFTAYADDKDHGADHFRKDYRLL